jgi:acyl-CoA oxidase
LLTCYLPGLASELLQDKYQIPPPSDPTSLLAQHEQGLFADLQQSVTRDSAGATNHRSDHFAQNITPRARDLVQAIGHRFAYESALASGTVRKELLDVWEADCILQDAAWYVENTELTNRGVHERYQDAMESVRPYVNAVIDEWDMERHFGSTPLVSKEHWDGFMGQLPVFGGDGVFDRM